MTYGPIIQEDVCTRCNNCVDGCPLDVIARPENPKETPTGRTFTRFATAGTYKGKTTNDH